MTQQTEQHPAHPTPAVVARRGAAVLGACAAAFALLYGLLVLTAAGQRLDARVMVDAWYVWPSLPWRCMRVLSLYRHSTYALAACSVLLWGLVRRGPGRTAVAGATLVGILASAEGLKHALPRPDLTWVPGPYGDLPLNSYPSGHTAGIAALTVAAVLLASPRRRRLVAALGALLTAAVGAALVVCQWHRPSDIVGSMLLATGWGAAALTAVELGPALLPVLGRRAPSPTR